MLAKDLISALKDLDPDCPVYYNDNDFETGQGCSEMKMVVCSDKDCYKEHPHATIGYGGKN